MTTLGECVQRVRSKNAGPFWVTVDVFCGSQAVYETVSAALDTTSVAARLGQPAATLKRFDIASLHVVKFSFPRERPQGARGDRDMHGAQWGVLLAEMRL